MGKGTGKGGSTLILGYRLYGIREVQVVVLLCLSVFASIALLLANVKVYSDQPEFIPSVCDDIMFYMKGFVAFIVIAVCMMLSSFIFFLGIRDSLVWLILFVYGVIFFASFVWGIEGVKWYRAGRGQSCLDDPTMTPTLRAVILTDIICQQLVCDSIFIALFFYVLYRLTMMLLLWEGPEIPDTLDDRHQPMKVRVAPVAAPKFIPEYASVLPPQTPAREAADYPNGNGSARTGNATPVPFASTPQHRVPTAPVAYTPVARGSVSAGGGGYAHYANPNGFSTPQRAGPAGNGNGSGNGFEPSPGAPPSSTPRSPF